MEVLLQTVVRQYHKNSKTVLTPTRITVPHDTALSFLVHLIGNTPCLLDASLGPHVVGRIIHDVDRSAGILVTKQTWYFAEEWVMHT